jgi:hypothetical protein
MNYNSCLNFKLSECIGDFGYYIRGVIVMNGRQRNATIAQKKKKKTTRIMMATVRHVTSGLKNFQAT